MLKKECYIIKPFVEKPWLKLTFRQVKEYIKSKSESYVYNTLKRLVSEELLKEEIVGKTILYSLNILSLKSAVYAGIAAEHFGWSQKQIPYKDITALSAKVQTNFFVLLITGSYAKNKQTRNSDIDVVILCDDCFEPKKVYAELKHACEINIPKIHLYVFKKSEYLQMLLDTKANYGKEFANNNLVIYGGEIYFKIMAEAIKNGFNG